jgi:hypothetical protein
MTWMQLFLLFVAVVITKISVLRLFRRRSSSRTLPSVRKKTLEDVQVEAARVRALTLLDTSVPPSTVGGDTDGNMENG